MSKSHTFMWDVNLLYTAVTRGKKRVILVGDKKTLSYCVANFKQNTRITGLKEQILEAFGQKPEEEMLVESIPEISSNSGLSVLGKKPSPFSSLRAGKPNPFKK